VVNTTQMMLPEATNDQFELETLKTVVKKCCAPRESVGCAGNSKTQRMQMV
jgi:hypothetical protein